MILTRLFLFLSVLMPLAAQTSQSRNADVANADFSAMPTKPFRLLSSLPASCSQGEAILKLPEATPYVCHPANTWIATGSGAQQVSAGRLSQMTDFAVAFAGGSATLGANCTVAAPCNAAFGAQVFRFTDPAAVSSLTGITGASTVVFFINSSGTRTLGLPPNASASVTNLTVVNANSFPNDSLPVASCDISNNQFTSCTDHRAFLRGLNIAGTNGISVTRTPGGIVIDYAGTAAAENPAFGPVMSAGAPSPGNLSVPPTCDGTNTNRAQLGSAGDIAVVRFTSTESGLVTLSQALPEEWSGPVDLEIWWTLASGSGNVQWKASTSCAAAGGTVPYTWNTFVAGSAQAGAAGSLRKASFTGASSLPVAGCSAGSLMRVGIMRDNGTTGNAGGDAQLISVRLKVRKTN